MICEGLRRPPAAVPLLLPPIGDVALGLLGSVQLRECDAKVGAELIAAGHLAQYLHDVRKARCNARAAVEVAATGACTERQNIHENKDIVNQWR